MLENHPTVEVLPAFGLKAVQLYEAMTTVSLVLVFFGLTMKYAQGSYGNISQIVRALVTGGIIAAIIPVFPDWINDLQIMGHSLVVEMDADPSDSHQRFARMIGGAVEGEEQDVGFWDILWADEGGLGKAFLYGGIFLAANLASAFMWMAMVVQQVLLLFAVALAPPFIAMFLIDSLRPTAVNYLLMIANLILWPLSWAAADLITDFLLNLSSSEKVYETADGYWVLTGSQSLFFIIVITLWISMSTLIAPRMIKRVLTNGANIGSEILSGFGASLGTGLSQGVGAAVTAGMVGGSRGAMASASAIGGVGGLMTGALGVSGGVLLPAAIGVGAATALPKGGGSNDEVDQQAASVAKKMNS